MELWNKMPMGYMAAAVTLLESIEKGVSTQTIYRNIFLQLRDMSREGSKHALYIYRRSTPRLEIAFNYQIPAETTKDLEETLNTLINGFDKPLLLFSGGENVLICPIFSSKEHYLVGVFVICDEISYLKRARNGMMRKPFKLFFSMLGNILYQVELLTERERDHYRDSLTGLHDECMLRRDIERTKENGRLQEYVFVMFNIKRLITVNDLYGYSKGNEVLFAISKILRNEVAARENAYRIEGDKFAVMFRTDYRRAYERIKIIIKAAESITFLGDDKKEGSNFHVSVSASIVDISKVDINHVNFTDYLYRAGYDYLPGESDIALYGQRPEKKNTDSTDDKVVPETAGNEPDQITEKDKSSQPEAAKNITSLGAPDREDFTADLFNGMM